MAEQPDQWTKEDIYPLRVHAPRDARVIVVAGGTEGAGKCATVNGPAGVTSEQMVKSLAMVVMSATSTAASLMEEALGLPEDEALALARSVMASAAMGMLEQPAGRRATIKRRTP